MKFNVNSCDVMGILATLFTPTEFWGWYQTTFPIVLFVRQIVRPDLLPGLEIGQKEGQTRCDGVEGGGFITNILILDNEDFLVAAQIIHDFYMSRMGPL